jgi:hypothetical protein
MPDYRAYTVGRDGHFTGFEPLVCADDAEAIEVATRLLTITRLSFGVARDSCSGWKAKISPAGDLY